MLFGLAKFCFISSLGDIWFSLAELETFSGVGVAGGSETKANLAQLGLELGLSLETKHPTFKYYLAGNFLRKKPISPNYREIGQNWDAFATT